MKRKSGRSKNSIGKGSSTYNKNIDLKIPKISNNLIINKPILKSKSKKGVAYNVNKTRKMDWKQLKNKFPNMNPYSDADFDGLVNSRDCKPLDPSKDGALTAFLGMIQGNKPAAKGLVKAVVARKIAEEGAGKKAEKILEKRGYISDTEREKLVKRQMKIDALRATVKSRPAEYVDKKVTGFLKGRGVATTQKQVSTARARRGTGIVKAVERFAGVKGQQTKAGKTAKGQSQAGAGRPKQSYKYKDPRTGQPISAVDYHRLRKELKSQAKTVETKTEIQQRFALAKRGLSPEEVEVAQEEINARMARLRAIKEAKQIEAQTEAPTETTEQLSPEDLEAQAIQQQIQQVPQQVVQQQVPQAQQQQVRSQVQRIQRDVGTTRVSHVEPMTAVPGSYGIPPGYKLQEDLMTGRKTLVPLPQREAWVSR